MAAMTPIQPFVTSRDDAIPDAERHEDHVLVPRPDYCQSALIGWQRMLRHQLVLDFIRSLLATAILVKYC